MATTVVLLPACGDDGDGVATGAGSTLDQAAEEAAEAVAPEEQPTGIALPENLPTADGLIPELAHLPLPDEVVLGVGEVLPDARETAVQTVYLALSVEEAVAFLLDELPAARFEIDSGVNGGLTDVADVMPLGENLIRFTDPDGVPGQVTIRKGAFSPAQMNINLYRGGVR